MNRLLTAIFGVFLMLALGACGSTQEVPDDEDRNVESEAESGQEEGSEMDGLRDDEMGEFRELDDPDSELAERIIYFDFDQDSVDGEYRDLVRSHAEYLRARPDLEVRLEGHTDERGSREYNIGLGDRRAGAVQQMLVLNGVDEEQIRTVSYGEERPAVDESNEEAWAENRRVEIIYIR